MGNAYDETKTLFRIGSQLASGGQGVVSYIEGVRTHCIKIYHQAPSKRDTEKLALLRSNATELSKIAALPTSIAFSDGSLLNPIGIFIPFVGGHEIYELYGTRSRLQHFPKANYKFLIHTAYNLALAFDELHSREILVADINEQNIKVLPNATVSLIDCDSFQISHGANIYTSDVGTAIWTPPELQGHNLTGFKRTKNHDLFGLAQMIFLLLFVGRHPFSGVPRTSRQILPEEAIKEYSFAFAPADYGSLLSPPPGCPPFNALPGSIQQLFNNAFLKGSNHLNARPTASAWKQALLQMLNQLVVCSRNPGHVFSKETSTCPWCLVISAVGIDLFPANYTNFIGGNNFTSIDQNFIDRLNNLRPYSFAVSPLPSFPNLQPEDLPPKPTGMWSAIQKTIATKSWKHSWLNNALKRNRQLLEASEAALRNTSSRQQTAIAQYNQEFHQLRPGLQPLLKQLSSPATIKREAEIAVGGERRKLELELFLAQFQIRHAKIRDIGKGRKAILQSYGIETAADVPNITTQKISGFGYNLIMQLKNWRSECERQFRFDASQSLPNNLRYEIERRFQAKIKKLKEEVAAFEIKLNASQNRCAEQLRNVQAQNLQYARQRDQAKINLYALETELLSKNV